MEEALKKAGILYTMDKTHRITYPYTTENARKVADPTRQMKHASRHTLPDIKYTQVGILCTMYEALKKNGYTLYNG